MTVRVMQWADGERGQKRWMVDVRARRADGSKVRDRKIVEGPRNMATAWGERRQAVLLGELRAPAAEDGPAKVMTVAQWAPIFVARHYQGKKQSAIDAATSIVETHIVPFAGSRPLDTLKQSVVDDLETTWRKGGYRETKRDRTIGVPTEKTVNNRKVVLISMLKYAVACAEETGLRKMPCKIKLAKIDTQRAPDFYEPELYAKIVETASKLNDPRCLAVVLLGGDAGLRVSEIIAAKRTDANYRTGKITPRSSVYQRSLAERFEDATKGGEEKPVKMTARLADALRALPATGEYLIHDDEGGPLTMKAIKWLVMRVERAAGLPVKGAVHVFRHTYASHLAMANVPVRQIMAMCRHKNLATTLRYMHLARDGQDHAVSALEKLRG